jgi:hypothetical protein
MWVESEAGQGSKFHFRKRVGSGADAAPAWRDAPLALRGKRILLVEDNAAQHRALAQLTQPWGLELVREDGIAGASARLGASGPHYDLLLLDYELLGATPAQTVARLRA